MYNNTMSKSQQILQEFSNIIVTGSVTNQGSVVCATETLAAASTLDSADSGKVFFLALANGFTTTLPPVQAGATLKFIVSVAPTTAYVITAGSAIIHGLGVTPQDAAGTVDSTANTPVTVINFVATKAKIGDYVELVSNGTNWFATAHSTLFDGVTFV
jgi:hypothetical protein